MSQRISAVLSEESMFASTSHECSTVSPARSHSGIIGYLRTALTLEEVV